MPPHCKPHHDSQVTGQLKDVPSQIEAVPLLVRRCIEALMVKQMVEAFSEEFDPKRVVDLAARAIRRSAFKAGEELAATTNDRSLEAFSCILDTWRAGGALEIDIIEQTATTLFFNVTRCCFAEEYKKLGMPELGRTLSCIRDFELARGFNPDIRLERTQTIMDGSPFCDFRFRFLGPDA
jgi:hypothetical protein